MTPSKRKEARKLRKARRRQLRAQLLLLGDFLAEHYRKDHVYKAAIDVATRAFVWPFTQRCFDEMTHHDPITNLYSVEARRRLVTVIDSVLFYSYDQHVSAGDRNPRVMRRLCDGCAHGCVKIPQQRPVAYLWCNVVESWHVLGHKATPEGHTVQECQEFGIRTRLTMEREKWMGCCTRHLEGRPDADAVAHDLGLAPIPDAGLRRS